MVVHCEYDPGRNIGIDPRKVKGTLHWVSAKFAVPVEVRQYDFLLQEDLPDPERWLEQLNPCSLEVVTGFAEPELKNSFVGARFQFLRHGYYCVDRDSTPAKIVFNRIVNLKDSFKN
jgi:glutaminyl-tRNA synthetase